MSINDRAFKFQLKRLPAIPALLRTCPGKYLFPLPSLSKDNAHPQINLNGANTNFSRYTEATSGARAIGLRHFTLVKVDEFDRHQHRSRQPQQIQQIQHAQQSQAQVMGANTGIMPQFVQTQLQNFAQGFQSQWYAGFPAPSLAPAPQATSQPQAPQQNSVPSTVQSIVARNSAHFHNIFRRHNTQGASSMTQSSPQQNSVSTLVQPTVAQNNAHFQSIFGGNNTQGAPSMIQSGPQYQSINGGHYQAGQFGQQNATQQDSQQSTLATGGYHLTVAGPSSAAQHDQIASSQPSNSALRDQRRLLLMAEAEVTSSRYFYINLRSEYFKLQIGRTSTYHYPTYSISQYPQLLRPSPLAERQGILQALQQSYELPSPIPRSDKLPDCFLEIEHLVLDLRLPPCHAELLSDGFKSWLEVESRFFCQTVVKPTIKKFPALKHLDLLIEGNAAPQADDRMVLRNWRDATIQDGNGLDFGHPELGLLEMEINLWMLSEYQGKNGYEGPKVRIVVHVPQRCSKTKSESQV